MDLNVCDDGRCNSLRFWCGDNKLVSARFTREDIIQTLNSNIKMSKIYQTEQNKALIHVWTHMHTNSTIFTALGMANYEFISIQIVFEFKGGKSI